MAVSQKDVDVGRSPENVELVRSGYEAWRRGDLEAAVASFAADFEPIENPVFPEARSYHGPDEFLAYARSFLDIWESWELDVGEILDAGNDVLAFVVWRVRGRGSGVEATMPIIHRWTLADGRVTRLQSYFDRDEALEAVRLRD
jgi:ketosteroid isomerase-like protein